ncbi:hypothetical protein D3C75_845090 [compost metagenome]
MVRHFINQNNRIVRNSSPVNSNVIEIAGPGDVVSGSSQTHDFNGIQKAVKNNGIHGNSIFLIGAGALILDSNDHFIGDLVNKHINGIPILRVGE